MLETLRALKQLGIQLVVDDFGVGYASLTFLREAPIDGIKIDRAFVKDLTHSSVDQAMVNAIIAMAKGLSLNLVAEGVETADQTLCLYELGCTEMQGYLFGYPQPAAMAAPFLQASHGQRWRLE